MIKNITDIIHCKAGNKITFEIPISNDRKVYMSVEKSNYCNDERCVVLVESNKLLELWRNEPYSIHREQSMGNPTTWSHDRKYGQAKRGFSFGIENPVPLADVTCGEATKNHPIYKRKFLLFKTLIGIEKEQIEYVAFTNGITRTIWLLANQAPFFPVECEAKNGSERLASAGGLATKSHYTVEELFQLIPDGNEITNTFKSHKQ
ncbi:hypothetical protein P4S66_03705 [Pseudoalteromonas sp. B129b]